MRSSEKVAAYE